MFKSTLHRIASGLAVVAIGLALEVSPVHAQYSPPGGYQAWNNYEQQSRAQWLTRREHYLGPMNVVNRAVYNVGNVVSSAVHTVKRTFGDPNYGYYDRWDRRAVVSRGPNPYGGTYAGYGYSNGYANNYQPAPAASQYYQATPAYRPTYGYGVNVFGR